MGHYSAAARYYDLLYAAGKDYQAEAEAVDALVQQANPGACRLLDVGCGTGEHARRLTDLGYLVDGVDIEPDFVAIASAKVPEGRFLRGDMMDIGLDRRYDAVLSLFSAIGYVETREGLQRAIDRMAAHVASRGVLVVEPWFEPGQLTDGWITMVTGSSDEESVCRMSRTRVEGRRSILEFEYLIGDGSGIRRADETHVLGLFTQDEMLAAFRDSGLDVEHREPGLRNRGVYIGRRRDGGR